MKTSRSGFKSERYVIRSLRPRSYQLNLDFFSCAKNTAIEYKSYKYIFLKYFEHQIHFTSRTQTNIFFSVTKFSHFLCLR